MEKQIRDKYNLLESKTAFLLYVGQKIGRGLSTMQHYMYDRPIPEDFQDIILHEVEQWIKQEVEAKSNALKREVEVG